MSRAKIQTAAPNCEKCFNSCTSTVDTAKAFKLFVVQNALGGGGSVESAASILNLPPSRLRQILKREIRRIVRPKK